MPSLIDNIAFRVGQAFCDLAAAVMYGQFRCRDTAALSTVGYMLIGAAMLIGFWLVFVRPRMK
jgi:hypothetical protein